MNRLVSTASYWNPPKLRGESLALSSRDTWKNQQSMARAERSGYIVYEPQGSIGTFLGFSIVANTDE